MTPISRPISDTPEADLTAWISRGDAPPRVHAAWAKAAMQRQDWPIALARWETYVTLFPALAHFAWRGRIASLQAMDRLEEADRELAQLVGKSSGADAKVHAVWAHSAMKRRNWQEAVDRWDRCLGLFPAQAAAGWHLGRISALQAMGRLMDADQALTELTASFPEARVLGLWARSAMRRREWNLALERWDVCFSTYRDPPDPEWRLLRAVAQTQIGLLKEAEASLREYVELAGAAGETAGDLQEIGAAPEAERIKLFLTVLSRALEPQVAKLLSERLAGTAAGHGWPAALQHLRNVVLACSFDQGPSDLGELLEAHGSRHWLLRLVVTILDDILITYFHHLPRGSPDPSARRCLVVAADMPKHSTGPHMRFTCSHAVALATIEPIESVQVLITQELGPEGPRVTDGAVSMDRISDWQAEILFLGGPAVAAKVSFATPERSGPVWSYEDSLAIAQQFRPDLVVAILGIYGSHVLPHVLESIAPIIGIQTNVNVPEPGVCDLVLAHGRTDNFADKPRPEKWRSHVVPVIPLSKTSKISPDELGPVSSFRVASALSFGRLERGLLADDAAVLDRVIRFLDDHPRAVWLMLGTEDLEGMALAVEARRQGELQERLRFMPWAPDLRAVYEHCHAYLHPQRDTGGGMAIAMAVAEGLPVIAPHNSDAANFLPPTTLSTTVDDAFGRLARFADDETYRRRTAESQRAAMETHNSLDQAGVALRRLFDPAYSSYQIRSGIEAAKE